MALGRIAPTVVQNQSTFSEEATSDLRDWLDSKSSCKPSTLEVTHLQGLLDAGADVNVGRGGTIFCNLARLIAGYEADFNKVETLPHQHF